MDLDKQYSEYECSTFGPALRPALRPPVEFVDSVLDDPLGERHPSEWRKQEERDVDHYAIRASLLVDNRLASGHDQYGTGEDGSLFKGKPLQHAKQEAGDLLHYINWAERELAAKDAMLFTANALLKQLADMIPEHGPLTTVLNIRHYMSGPVRAYLADMNAMIHSDEEATYQWLGGTSR